MLFGINPAIHSKLKVEFENLKKENDKLKSINTTYQTRYEHEENNASFSIDWNAMKVFSVERNFVGVPRSILGYMLSAPAVYTEKSVTYNDDVREWTLQCSAEKHEELVKEFNEWKVNKK